VPKKTSFAGKILFPIAILLITGFVLPNYVYAAVYDVREFGAKGDGVTNDAGAIQRAIDACSRAGGGRVLLPAGGVYYSGSITLKANVDLHVERGAVLKASGNRDDYGPQGSFIDDSAGSLINAENASSLSISGGGVIDGNSPAFMGKLNGDIFEPQSGRPVLVFLVGCNRLTITGITLKNSPFWTIHLVGCEDVSIEGIRILNDPRVPNCDGIDPDHCRNVRIANCLIVAGDDGIVPKNSGGRFSDYGPCENITVTGCIISSRSCAIKLGTGGVDDFRNMVFDSCVIYGSNRGIGLQIRDSGDAENIIFSNITFHTELHGPRWWGKAEPIYITAIPRHPGTRVGKIRNVRFSNILCRGENGVYIHGWKDNPVEDIVFDNIKIEIGKWTDWAGGEYDLRPNTGYKGVYKHKIAGIYCRYARDLTIRNTKVAWKGEPPEYFGPALEVHDVDGLRLDNFTGKAAHPGVERDRIID